MNITFGGMESYNGNIRLKAGQLNKYLYMDKLILFRPERAERAKSATTVKPKTDFAAAMSIREEEERMILGAWILGAISVGTAVMSLAA